MSDAIDGVVTAAAVAVAAAAAAAAAAALARVKRVADDVTTAASISAASTPAALVSLDSPPAVAVSDLVEPTCDRVRPTDSTDSRTFPNQPPRAPPAAANARTHVHERTRRGCARH